MNMDSREIDAIASVPPEKKIVACIDAYLITPDEIPKDIKVRISTNKYRCWIVYLIALIASMLLGFCISHFDGYRSVEKYPIKGTGSDSDGNKYEFNIKVP